VIKVRDGVDVQPSTPSLDWRTFVGDSAVSALSDIIGHTFGRLTVVGMGDRARDGKRLWRCSCTCGGETTATAYQLKIGHKKSCGCWRHDNAVNLKTTHGKSQTRLSRIWRGMRQRCSNPNVAAFPRYGGRGIIVCEEWGSFIKFYDWAMANGYSDALSIDRINNDGNYEPTNCRWATTKAQGRNQPQNRAVIRSDGKRFNYVSDAARASKTTTANIALVCKGRRKHAGGFGWSYEPQRESHGHRSADRNARRNPT
jgi:hypothetical protein